MPTSQQSNEHVDPLGLYKCVIDGVETDNCPRGVGAGGAGGGGLPYYISGTCFTLTPGADGGTDGSYYTASSCTVFAGLWNPAGGVSGAGGAGGKPHNCVAKRIVKGVQGLANITLGELKSAGAVGVGALGAAGAPATGGASLSTTLAAGYVAVSAQGQVFSGTGQLYAAVSGNFQTGEQMQQVGDIISGPISGFTLVTSKNPEAAALAGNAESATTLGAGAVNSETVADRIAEWSRCSADFLRGRARKLPIDSARFDKLTASYPSETSVIASEPTQSF